GTDTFQKTVLYGESYPEPSGLTKEGYFLTGWYEDVALLVPHDFSSPAHGSLELWAKWEPNPYIVRFNANWGTDKDVDQSMIFDTAVQLNPNSFARLGYEFTGWNTSVDGTGFAYSDGQEVKNLTSKRNGIVKLYAQWKGEAYSVLFDGNGSNEGVMETQTFYFGQYSALSKNSFRKTGFTFTGWNTKADGSGVPYGDLERVTDLAPVDLKTVTMYAQWKETYNVTVPVGPTIQIDAQGAVTEDTTTFFSNNGPTQVSIVAAGVSVLPGASQIFSQPQNIELVMASKNDNRLKVSAFLEDGSFGYCRIPISGSSKLPVIFSLDLRGSTVSYSMSELEVASLAYTFEVA
ncbi:MAG: InlB B-repeat-containing protein, partial [Raoultibacter sp.]